MKSESRCFDTKIVWMFVNFITTHAHYFWTIRLADRYLMILVSYRRSSFSRASFWRKQISDFVDDLNDITRRWSSFLKQTINIRRIIVHDILIVVNCSQIRFHRIWFFEYDSVRMSSLIFIFWLIRMRVNRRRSENWNQRRLINTLVIVKRLSRRTELHSNTSIVNRIATKKSDVEKLLLLLFVHTPIWHRLSRLMRVKSMIAMKRKTFWEIKTPAMFASITAFMRRCSGLYSFCFEVDYWVSSCCIANAYWDSSSVCISQFITIFNFLFELIMRL